MRKGLKKGRGTGDATLTLMNTVSKHLQQPKSYARILFIDFSSAFNCMKKHTLIKRLCDTNTNKHIVQWIKEFLTDRPQRVRYSGLFSDTVTLNSGAPQGCVLSPVLFSLYTNEMQIMNPTCHLYKYADDMALVGLMQAGNNAVNQSIYFQCIEKLTKWCQDSNLSINETKTKELVMTMSNNTFQDSPVIINAQPVEKVEEFKYLGTFFDCTLSFTMNTDYIF